MNESFNPGDLVSLKSGGPEMTVSCSEGDETYCVWWDGRAKRQEAFPTITLRSVTKSAGFRPVRLVR
jgi:uncharacterized protein YodC (DUF2158 family)